MFIGRETERRKLLQALRSDRSEFMAVYGRHRVGKTFLIRETYSKEIVFQHTGLALGNMKRQLKKFCISLQEAGYKEKCAAKKKRWLSLLFCLAIMPCLAETLLKLPPMPTPPVIDGRIGEEVWLGGSMQFGAISRKTNTLARRVVYFRAGNHPFRRQRHYAD